MNNRDLLENQNGVLGIEFISDTAKHVAPLNQKFVKLQVLATAVIASIEPQPTGNTYTSFSFPAGTVLEFEFNSITLTSGTVIAYKGV